MLLVDTNVILDVVQEDPIWADWSQRQLDRFAALGDLCINSLIYTELSMAFQRIEEIESVVAKARFKVLEIPREALFLAGKVFLRYKKNGGTKSGVLPDFFIGAHASVLNVPLLTRDQARYRTYYPHIKLLTPGS